MQARGEEQPSDGRSEGQDGETTAEAREISGMVLHCFGPWSMSIGAAAAAAATEVFRDTCTSRGGVQLSNAEGQ